MFTKIDSETQNFLQNRVAHINIKIKLWSDFVELVFYDQKLNFEKSYKK